MSYCKVGTIYTEVEQDHVHDKVYTVMFYRDVKNLPYVQPKKDHVASVKSIANKYYNMFVSFRRWGKQVYMIQQSHLFAKNIGICI